VKLPHFPVPEGRPLNSYLRQLCDSGLRTIYKRVPPEAVERLRYELSIIERMGYAAYFLIVQDSSGSPKRTGILTTVRGSAAGALFCTRSGSRMSTRCSTSTVRAFPQPPALHHARHRRRLYGQPAR